MTHSESCLWCGEDTSFGSGRFVNRIPASRQDAIDDEYRDGFQCAECQAINCNVCKEPNLDYEFSNNANVICRDCIDYNMEFLYDEQIVKKYGHLFNIDIKNFEYGNDQWLKFLDDLRGLTFVDSVEDGYLIQEIKHD